MTEQQNTVNVAELQVGTRIRVVGRDTRGWTVVREGYLVAEPKHTTAQWDLKRRRVVRLHVDKESGALPSRQNWTTVLPDATAVVD
ncbi:MULTISPECIES: hypothetical protein [Streptomyces]|uniref:hypothetical protein n=1 Tax=Streptomyces TaxID=1883 RepID=UPI00345C3183